MESPSDCLAVYDLMTTEQHTAVEVYAKVFGIKKEHRHLDLFTDARSERGMLRDYVCDYDKLTKEQVDDELLQSEAMAYAKAKMEWRKTQRVASAYDDGKGDFFKDTRALTKAS